MRIAGRGLPLVTSRALGAPVLGAYCPDPGYRFSAATNPRTLCVSDANGKPLGTVSVEHQGEWLPNDALEASLEADPAGHTTLSRDLAAHLGWPHVRLINYGPRS